MNNDLANEIRSKTDIVDIIAGTFFVCKISEENFEGFVDEKEAEYWQKIFEPVQETFIHT